MRRELLEHYAGFSEVGQEGRREVPRRGVLMTLRQVYLPAQRSSNAITGWPVWVFVYAEAESCIPQATQSVSTQVTSEREEAVPDKLKCLLRMR